ncbi:MFS transporter [Thermodesulfobacteriota bacterium]
MVAEKGSNPVKTNIKVIVALTMVHFIGDFYASFINPLLPAFEEQFSLSLMQVGLITGTSRLLAFIVQPSVGYLADNYRTRWFVLGGPLLAIFFISLVGAAPNFSVLLLFICLGSIGTSMYHPPAAGMITTYAGRHFGTSMSIFHLGGTISFGLGPFFITYLVGTYGLGVTPLTMVIGLGVMVYLFFIVPHPQGEGLSKYGFLGSIREALGAVWKSIVIIWLVMVLRAFVGQSFQTFVPVMLVQEGYSLISAGAMIACFSLAGALGGLLAGYISDKIGYRYVFMGSFFLTTPCLYLLLLLPGNWVYLGSGLSGFFLMAMLPMGVALAQELAPKGKSLVSSLMMGLAFGAGGMMAPVTGSFADIYSLRTVLEIIAVIPLFLIGLVVFFPGKAAKAI